MSTRDDTHSFQSEHSPRGAEASFSMGHVGSGGGFSLESGNCGDQDIFLGFFRDGTVHCMPYNRQGSMAIDTGMGEFVPTGDPESGKFPPVDVRFIPADEITREYRLATDTWRTDGIEFSLVTPVSGIPDPETVPGAAFRDAICPAVTGRLVFDNTSGSTPMQGFFAVGGLAGLRQLDELTGGEMAGIVTLGHYGFAVPGGPGVAGFSDMFMDFPFRRPAPNRNFLRGIAGVIVAVAPGERVELPLALGWYKPGVVTLGKDCAYLYTQHFAGLEDVLRYALRREPDWRAEALEHDARLLGSAMNEPRRFLYAKAVRSYWGSTQLLAEGDRPRWVVNEGSCNMANTLDLTVDMAFFEAREHPWLLRNVLDAGADEYSYVDRLHFPGEENLHEGGVSFTHDHGARNAFSRPGWSHYEARNHPACFSYMTHEELLNWVLCAALYVRATDDRAWLHRRAALVADCLESMQRRDHPDPAQRDGLMSLDSSRCGSESEITTYDSLDPSLGQARNNTYMGVKCWAAYLAIEWMLALDDTARWDATARGARLGAELAAQTVANAFDPELGYIPAILEGGDRSAIIPIVEGLVYPDRLGLADAVDPEGPFAPLLGALRRHLEAVLVPGRCLFPDGGWKLSGNNDNSWMSKIFINQYVAQKILGLEPDPSADLAHEQWWRVGCCRQSVIDQVVAGASTGAGAIYPRCVSCVLWDDLPA